MPPHTHQELQLPEGADTTAQVVSGDRSRNITPPTREMKLVSYPPTLTFVSPSRHDLGMPPHTHQESDAQDGPNTYVQSFARNGMTSTDVIHSVRLRGTDQL